MESVEFVQWCLNHLDYVTVMILMVIESSFIPFPSEIVIPPAAYHAAQTGDMNILLLVLCATLGANIGALINYVIAYYAGRPIVYKFANSKLGHFCLIDQEKVEKAEKYFAAHGAVSTFVGRLIPAIRQLISIPAGLSKMKISTFLIFTTLGAGVWNSVLAAAGYYMSFLFSEEEMMGKLAEYSFEFKMICLGLAVIIIGVLVYNVLKHRKKKPAAEADAATEE
ncbi:MAG: DedA family protein [Bacteroidales bacterium]|nr:DedA family protein [Bacteroidales bacterium]